MGRRVVATSSRRRWEFSQVLVRGYRAVYALEICGLESCLCRLISATLLDLMFQWPPAGAVMSLKARVGPRAPLVARVLPRVDCFAGRPLWRAKVVVALEYLLQYLALTVRRLCRVSFLFFFFSIRMVVFRGCVPVCACVPLAKSTHEQRSVCLELSFGVTKKKLLPGYVTRCRDR